VLKRVEPVWKEKHVVHSYEVDVRGRAKPHVLFRYMLNSAWNHALSSEFSYEKLSNRGHFWALARFLMICNQFPQWNDQVVVETWGKDTDRFYALRDFIIHSTEGEKLVVATSSWLILNTETYRPQKLDRLREYFPFQFGRHELDVKLDKIHALVREQERSRYVVHFTDIDVNKHVNASKYMQWMLDGYSVEILEKKALKSFDLNFIAEAKIDDEIIVSVESAKKHDLCSVRRVTDSKELCRARLEWAGDVE